MDIAADERFKSRDGRRKHYEALEQMLAPTFKTKSREQWLKILEAHDVPAVPLYDVAEVLDDPQVKHLGLIEEVEHLKAGKFKFVGGPVHFDSLPKDEAAAPPLVGEHSEKILRQLGYDDAAIEELRTQCVTQVAG